MDIAFLTTRLERPSFRFRIAQFLPTFGERGHRCEVVTLPSNLAARILAFRRLSRFDAVVLQQRLLSRLELAILRRSCRTLIYDVDDAVMFGAEGKRQWRRPGRFAAMARSADLVICGNSYLAAEAARHTDRLAVIPTAVDTDAFHPAARAGAQRVVTVGWTGSGSTNRYLNEILPVLSRLPDRARIKIISGTREGLDLHLLNGRTCEFVTWSAGREVAETASFDIGLMPLPDTRWTRGKCGCKALQYMALGIPAVCSPVGVNCDIIEHGRNGFLARTPDEWLAILSMLIDDPAQREAMGRAGRETVEGLYSVRLQGPRLVEAIERSAA